MSESTDQRVSDVPTPAPAARQKRRPVGARLRVAVALAAAMVVAVTVVANAFTGHRGPVTTARSAPRVRTIRAAVHRIYRAGRGRERGRRPQVGRRLQRLRGRHVR